MLSLSLYIVNADKYVHTCIPAPVCLIHYYYADSEQNELRVRNTNAHRILQLKTPTRNQPYLEYVSSIETYSIFMFFKQTLLPVKMSVYEYNIQQSTPNVAIQL